MSGNVFLGLGSNMGRRTANLRQAIARLAPQVVVVRLSSFYDTAPQGNTDQPRFLNAVCQVNTSLAPQALLILVKDIERRMGRQSGPVNHPRPIDIDILFYDSLIIDAPDLVIPHPRLAQREFVLKPLCEIAPDLVHPVLRETAIQLLTKIEGTEDMALWNSE
jgi:2-amino-4-hydroxy-6-hydroxymethyldihydropteridine diphosphokinase